MAFIASITALDMAGRLRVTKGSAAFGWLFGGAFSMGVGVWSMHFIGMLAMKMHYAVSYDLSTTLLSLVAGFVACVIALSVVKNGHLTMLRLTVSALIMGTGISLMHYLGMEAMKINGQLAYDYSIFAISIPSKLLPKSGL